MRREHVQRVRRRRRGEDTASAPVRSGGTDPRVDEDLLRRIEEIVGRRPAPRT